MTLRPRPARCQTLPVAGSDILDDLRRRGLIHDSTDLDALAERLDAGPVTVYAGFDPTADSLQIGNLVPLLLLRRFQQHGHRPIALAGGATGMIGDPGGKSEERNLLDGDTLTRNVAAVTGQLDRLVDFDAGDASARLVDNRTWTEPVGVLQFLREVGKHVTVNQMLAKESVRARVEGDSGISYTEFSYMLLQAFDYQHLFDTYHCELQVGGSDQWGNITAGIDLIRRSRQATVHGLVVPLLTDAGGHKLGKTAAGAVWLDPDQSSPDDFYQYFVNLPDDDAERVLLQLTLLPVDEIEAVMDEHRGAPEKRLAQRTLAGWMTDLVHGESAASRAADASRSFTTAAGELSVEALEALADEIPTTHVALDRFADGIELVDLAAEVGLVGSKGEARRLLAQAGLYVNDVAQHDARRLTRDDLLHGAYLMLRKGKKARHLVVADA
jgi:tyrosyl-tRNA synthetase